MDPRNAEKVLEKPSGNHVKKPSEEPIERPSKILIEKPAGPLGDVETWVCAAAPDKRKTIMLQSQYYNLIQ